jgi:hypothetical protein
LSLLLFIFNVGDSNNTSNKITENEAAIVIQCAYRCCIARRWVRHFQEFDLWWQAIEDKAAFKIQSFIAMVARRSSFQKSLRAAKKIQAFIRNQKYRAKLLLWRKLARLEEAHARAKADEQARIQRDLAEADTFLAQGRASDQEAREAVSLLVIEPAAEEAKDDEGKYAYHVLIS